MPHHRFYAPLENFTAAEVYLPDDEAHHAVHVLRIRVGETVNVFDGQGRAFCAVVTEASKRGVRLVPAEPLPSNESPLDLTLAAALLKADKFEWVIQKAVELGVTRIVPLVTRHVEPGLVRGLSAERLSRWARISREATKQCGRSRLTPVTAPRPLAEVTAMEGVKFFFTEHGGQSWSRIVKGIDTPPSVVTAFVGPEGGWSHDERTRAVADGAHLVTLGRRILRAETAGILAVGLLQSAFGDFVDD
ncbi:MAG: 16S rRNA (uracil(1498)-N(3))-methyltransferase [Chloracidobacterium sp.]|nr:16S rRNA (uracil(1498)-N(3))-methyltransferase [Chloracidobacterium sp.]MDW8218126.1 16S rRNA (uracil(1498)-N(3))-methyltransferase [Acidobacteriota bacterium]